MYAKYQYNWFSTIFWGDTSIRNDTSHTQQAHDVIMTSHWHDEVTLTSRTHWVFIAAYHLSIPFKTTEEKSSILLVAMAIVYGILHICDIRSGMRCNMARWNSVYFADTPQRAHDANNVVSTSMRCHHVAPTFIAPTSILRHFTSCARWESLFQTLIFKAPSYV